MIDVRIKDSEGEHEIELTNEQFDHPSYVSLVMFKDGNAVSPMVDIDIDDLISALSAFEKRRKFEYDRNKSLE